MKISALFVLLLFYHVVAAQKKTDSLTTGTTFLRCNLLNVADLSEPNISFGIERRIFNNISAALDEWQDQLVGYAEDQGFTVE